MQDYFGIFQVLSEHIQVAGWIILVIFAWRVSAKFEKFMTGVHDAQGLAKSSEEVIKKVAINHIPHLQEGIDTVNDNITDLKTELLAELRGVRSDLLQYALRKD